MNPLNNFIHALKLFSQRNYTIIPRDAKELRLKKTVSELAYKALSELKNVYKNN